MIKIFKTTLDNTLILSASKAARLHLEQAPALNAMIRQVSVTVSLLNLNVKNLGPYSQLFIFLTT
jgi:hypothetical protein